MAGPKAQCTVWHISFCSLGMEAALEVPEALHMIDIFQREAAMVVSVRRGVVMTLMAVVEEAMEAVSEVMVDPSVVIPHLIVGMGPLLSERDREATVDLPLKGRIHLEGPIPEVSGDEKMNSFNPEFGNNLFYLQNTDTDYRGDVNYLKSQCIESAK